MISRFVLLLLVITPLAWMNSAQADESTANRHIQNADLVGEARLKVMFWNIFDAQLFAPDGQYSESRPFALSLSYLRQLDSRKLVDSTIEEMAGQGRFDSQELAKWEAELNEIFPDVDKNTTITGVRDENGHTLFYQNGQPIGKIANERFTRGFFDIWLGESSSQPELRKRLLSIQQS